MAITARGSPPSCATRGCHSSIWYGYAFQAIYVVVRTVLTTTILVLGIIYDRLGPAEERGGVARAFARWAAVAAVG
jgi:hypothetical protein